MTLQICDSLTLPLFRLLDVMHDDNEENAELAIKIMNEMQRFYRNTFNALVIQTPTLTLYSKRQKMDKSASFSIARRSSPASPSV